MHHFRVVSISGNAFPQNCGSEARNPANGLGGHGTSLLLLDATGPALIQPFNKERSLSSVRHPLDK
jgi:hypothetical protein